jgi:hypothetical protein
VHLRIADVGGGAFVDLVSDAPMFPGATAPSCQHRAGDENKVGAVERCDYFLEPFSKDAMAHSDFGLALSNLSAVLSPFFSHVGMDPLDRSHFRCFLG